MHVCQSNEGLSAMQNFKMAKWRHRLSVPCLEKNLRCQTHFDLHLPMSHKFVSIYQVT